MVRESDPDFVDYNLAEILRREHRLFSLTLGEFSRELEENPFQYLDWHFLPYQKENLVLTDEMRRSRAYFAYSDLIEKWISRE